jgi:uncharacterized membrane protein
MEDGGHQEMGEFIALYDQDPVVRRAAAAWIGIANGAALAQMSFIGNFLDGINSGKELDKAVKDAKLKLYEDVISNIIGEFFDKYVRPTDMKEAKDIGYEIAKAFDGAALGRGLTGGAESVFEIDWLGIARSVIEIFAERYIEGAERLIAAFGAGLMAGTCLGLAWIERNFPNDPPILPHLSTDLSSLLQPPVSMVERQLPSNLVPAPLSTSVITPNLSVTNQLRASWSSDTTSNFLATSLNASSATVKDANGTVVGSGAVVLNQANLVPLSVSGNVTYHVNGQGSLSFYAQATTNLGVSGDWNDYAATLDGNPTVQLTTGALTLNGITLPLGTYTIITVTATLAGSGASSSPSFASSLSIDATDDTVDLGPGTGDVAVGGAALDPMDGVTLTGYTGSIKITPNGIDTDSVTLNGNADNVLQVTGSPATLTTDQNTPVTFQVNLATSLADTYTLTAQAPQGWTVTVDNNGYVTATPAAGLQGGTFPIRLVARSKSNPDLVAQGVVLVTLTPTQPGITLAVQLDNLFTVPFQGAQLPTAFEALIHNSRPTAETFNLTFPTAPDGFTILNSGTNVTIPAGETGVIGIYLEPTGQLPPPGTRVSFTVSVSSTTDPAITSTGTQSFTIPEMHGISLASIPASPSSTPGVPVTTTITLQNVGNVPENITLAATLPPGLTAGGLSSVALEVGQSVKETITLTTDAATPYNTTLIATLTATYGLSGSPLTQTIQVPVQVVIPGIQAIHDAGAAATQLGNADLAARLNDLTIALTNLFQEPSSDVFKSQTLASLDSIIGQLAADPYLSALKGDLAAARGVIADASTPEDIRSSINSLGNTLGSLATILSDEARHNLTVTLEPNSQVAQPQTPTMFPILLQNSGTETTTYNLSLGALPDGVTGSLSQVSITLAPGQSTVGGAAPTLFAMLTQTSTTHLAAFSFDVIVSAAGAPEISRTATGAFTARAEIVSVVSVDTDPPFTDPGGQVTVSARVLNAVNQEREALASYVVTDPSGQVVFTSQPVTATFGVLATLTTIGLGTLDTTNLASGQYTITVSVSSPDGQPIPGGAGEGRLLIGSPVTASMSTTPTIAPPGDSAVTNTLQIDSHINFASPLSLVGQVQTSGGAQGLALMGTLAYVGGPDGISIVDVANPASPTVVKTFGSDVIPSGSNLQAAVDGNQLVVVVRPPSSPPFSLLVYSLADPLNPQLLGQNSSLNYQFPFFDVAVQNGHAFVQIGSIWYSWDWWSEWGNIYEQHGDLLSIDLNDPAGPTLTGAMFTQPPSGQPRGDDYNVWQIAEASNDTLLVASTTATGGDTQSGIGRVLVVSTTDPDQPTLVGELDIPGTVQVVGIAKQGNRALVLGSSGGRTNSGSDPSFPWTGHVVLATLDLTDPRYPQLIATQDLSQASSNAMGRLVSLGNGVFAAGISGTGSQNPALMLIDASDPRDLVVSQTEVATTMTPRAVEGNLLYTTSASGVFVYDIGAILGTPVTARVTVPRNSIVPDSFSLQPTTVISGTDSDTLEWDLSLTPGKESRTITWQSVVTGLQPGESRPVTQGSTVTFVNQGTTGTLILPPTAVVGQQILAIDPAPQTTKPGQPASYKLIVDNPTGSDVTYYLSLQGVPSSWANLPSSVTVPAGGETDLMLTFTSDAFAPTSDYGFVITASASTGATGSVNGTLTLAGQPAPPDPEAHGIVVSLSPTQAGAGQGTPTSYVVRVTNAGSAVDTFTLTAAGLPSGVAATFGRTTIDVPPGASSFRDVTLTLTPRQGTAPGNILFTVTATSATKSTVSNTASGTLAVLGNGVAVTLTPTSATPGTSLQVTVTNTGQVTDTFDLALGGPAAAVASLGTTTKVTLAPGASQQVTITTGAVNFADPGALNLTAIATSEGNPAVQDSATASLQIAPTKGLTVQFDNTSQTLTAPGTASFLLLVNNTGNTEDAYTATITGTSGPITAILTGLDGEPTRTIPIFRLPGLSTGAILLQTSLSAFGQGTVTVQVTSLSNPSMIASATATVTAATASKADTTTIVAPSPGSPVYGQSLTFTATVGPVTQGLPTPSGTVQFKDGSTVLDTETLVGGTASFSTAGLTAGSHTITAVYSGDTSFNASTAATLSLTVAPATPTVGITWAGWTYDGTAHAASGSVRGVGSPPEDLGTPTFTYYAGSVTDAAHQLSGAPKDAGTYTVVASYASGSNYNPASSSATITISPKAATVTALNQTITYGGSPDLMQNSNTVQVSGLVSGDSLSVNLSVSGAPASGHAPVGSYTITPSGLTSSNYSITYVGGTLMVTPKALTVTASDASRTYGALDPTFTYTLSGFVPGEDATTAGVTGSPVLGTTATRASDVGTYAITVAAGTLAAANYDFPNLVAGKLTITRAPLTITADNKTKVYGDPIPALSASYDGFVLGQEASVLGGVLNFATPVTQLSDVGSYVITLSGLTSSNYSITFKDGTLSVTPAPLSVTPADKTREYGLANPTLDGTISATRNGDVFTASYATSATPASDVGTYNIMATLAGVNGAKLTNYDVAYNVGHLSITPATLTITPNDIVSKVYGSTASLTGVITGARNGDTFTATYASPGAATTADVGTYTISVDAVTANGAAKMSNYTLVKQTATLQVTPAPLTVTTDAKSRAYGADNPPFTGSVTGIQNGDAITATFGCSATITSPVGGYAITATLSDPGHKQGNYTVTNPGSTLTIKPAHLTVTADPATRQYSDPDPKFTATISGFKNNETLATSGVAGSPSLTSSDTASSPAGNFVITPAIGTLAATNYDFPAANFITGVLTVTQEDAFIQYSGDAIALTGSSLTLRVTAWDSAAVGYPGINPESGGTIGDITKMWIAFDIYPAGSVLSGSPTKTLYAQVLDTGTTGDGIGTATTTFSSSSEASYGVVARLVAGNTGGVNQYYTAADAQPAGITFYTNTGQFVTGGGWVNDPGGGPGNFGFNARYNKNNQPQGQMVYVYRGTYNGVLSDYVIKSNSLTGLSFSGTTFPISATLQGKATIQINRASDGSQLYSDGNATFTATATDSGSSSGIGTDSFALSVWDKNGVPYKSVGQTTLMGGNIVVHNPSHLQAAGGAVDGGTASATLDPAMLTPIVEEAKARWIAAGIAPRRLSNLDVRIADLPGPYLGEEFANVIEVDRDAAGYGWYVDPTPGDDSEFAPGAVRSPALGHMDLLSVVAHELGHELGFAHDNGDDVMNEALPAGVRRVPLPRVMPATSIMPIPMPAARSSLVPSSGPSDGIDVSILIDLALEQMTTTGLGLGRLLRK